jgi:hypothetical protein
VSHCHTNNTTCKTDSLLLILGPSSCALVWHLRDTTGLFLIVSSTHPAWRVQPRNYLLFACHGTNFLAQSVQDVRYVKYWYLGGKEAKEGVVGKVEHKAEEVKGKVTEAIEQTREEAKAIVKK